MNTTHAMHANPQDLQSSLSDWLQGVSCHLELRRQQSRSTARPPRNRARERARREARQLFAEFYAEQAIHLGGASVGHLAS